MSRALSLAFVLCIVGVYSHSWLQCADYRPQTATDVTDYNPKACKAWPRSWVQKFCPQTNSVADFGIDCGYNYQPPVGGSVCSTARGNPLSSQYAPNAPMAKYAPGQVVCLAWPPKNHVGLACPGSNQWNDYILDRGTQVWMTGPDPTADPTVTTTATGAKTMKGATLIQDWGKCLDRPNQAFKAFMNCPRFCSNIPTSPGNALCSNCFQLPTNLRVGSTYTFVWAWWFNSDTDLYTSCWEAQIVATPDTAPADGFKAYTNFTRLPTYPVFKPSGGVLTTVAWDYYKATYNPPPRN